MFIGRFQHIILHIAQEQEQSPRERFASDFAQGLQEGGEEGVQKMVAASRRVSVALTELSDDWGNPGDANYDSLLAQMSKVVDEYMGDGEARTVLYLNDGGTSRLQIYYDGQQVIAKPTNESSEVVKDNWRRSREVE